MSQAPPALSDPPEAGPEELRQELLRLEQQLAENLAAVDALVLEAQELRRSSEEQKSDAWQMKMTRLAREAQRRLDQSRQISQSVDRVEARVKVLQRLQPSTARSRGTSREHRPAPRRRSSTSTSLAGKDPPDEDPPDEDPDPVGPEPGDAGPVGVEAG